MKQRFILSLLALMLHLGAWAALGIGDIFTADGITYKVTSTSPKEVQVGTGDLKATAIANTTAGDFIIPSAVRGMDGNDYTVTSIGTDAFFNCSSLTTIAIPKNVKSIGGSAFYGCSGLMAVHITDLAAWCGISFADRGGSGAVIIRNNTLYLVGSNPLCYAHRLYLNGSEIKDMVIPNSVTSISDLAFLQFTGLTSVTIPKNVMSIGENAFNGCGYLTSVHSNITEPFAIASNVFSKYTIPLYVPSGTRTKYEATEGWNAFEDIVQDDPQSPVKIGTVFAVDDITYKVYSNSPLEVQVGTGQQRAIDKETAGEIDIPSTVKDNDGYTYTVTIIGESAFADCSKLTSVSIPKTVKKIGRVAFFGCDLTSVTIPRSVTTIGNQAFDYVQSTLTSITVEEGNTVFDSRGGCNAIIRTAENELILGCRNTVIPNSVTTIGKRAFTQCTGLTEINIYQAQLPQFKKRLLQSATA